ncbi:hypothetical protein PoB_003808600 [Plakobranchus ocellatus]|uniref:Ig-like domain-containing protein n=1 Tax=Plakobranchus ocellatus TaxID=259542 RepID=A0AAV4AYH1_9GAST|nr:hypothetical protein PoB_003808600 [Plakobranchus ocellatus]
MVFSRALILLAVVSTGIQGFIDDSRDLKVLYDSNVNLTCADDKFNPLTMHNATFQWLMPTGQVLDVSTLNVTGHFTLLDNGSTLIIEDVDRPDFGLYICLVSLPDSSGAYSGIHFSVGWAVNIDGPYYGNMWDKYWPRAKIGLMAGAAVFVFMSMLCINLDQFQSHHEKREGEPVRVSLQPYFPDHKLTRDGPGTAYRNPLFNDLPSSYDHAGVSSLDTSQADDQDQNDTHKQEMEPKTSF